MKNSIFGLSFSVIIIWLLSGCHSKQASTDASTYKQYFNADWAKNKVWDDGKAEVARYKAQRTVYGKQREFEYTYIAVKEIFNEQYTVKTDDYNREDLYPVIKVNKFCSFETKAYPYHYLTSVFFKQDSPEQVHKLTNTSQEWCGNTAKSFVEKNDHYLFEYMSYWDNQGNGSAKIDKNVLFEDQLSYSLRSLKFKEGLTFNADIYPMQINSHAKKPVAVSSTIQVSKSNLKELGTIPPELINQPWKVSVTKNNGAVLNYWFNGSYPNVLLKMTASDGRSLEIIDSYRDAYWSHE